MALGWVAQDFDAGGKFFFLLRSPAVLLGAKGGEPGYEEKDTFGRGQSPSNESQQMRLVRSGQSMIGQFHPSRACARCSPDPPAFLTCRMDCTSNSDAVPEMKERLAS